jgi:hypothetical protein
MMPRIQGGLFHSLHPPLQIYGAMRHDLLRRGVLRCRDGFRFPFAGERSGKENNKK